MGKKHSREGYELCRQEYKTTITAPGGISLGYGPGPGLRQAMFWNRIGALFSCYRPSVAVLTLFDANDPQRPLELRETRSEWLPGLASARYKSQGLRLKEQRYADKTGLHARLLLKNSGSAARELLACFSGSVEQWPFFDYQRQLDKPQVTVQIERDLPLARITQPHVFEGIGSINSIQRVWLELPEGAACCGAGFGNSESDLRALWREHGADSHIRMRLGQTGGRYAAADGGNDSEPDTIEFRHAQPHYYMTIRLRIEAGAECELLLRTDFHTDDEEGDLRSEHARRREYPEPTEETERQQLAWQRHLHSEVPQIECDDAELERYWYYVWYVLRANRTSGGRHLPADYSAPSKYMYWGSWIWDSYFHVLGEMWLSDPQPARDSLRNVLAMQYPNGFIPVCSGSNYRMVFHEDVDGYLAPQGMGYAGYVESRLDGYRELEHPFESQLSYLRRSGTEPELPLEQRTPPQARLLELNAVELENMLRLAEGYAGLIINLSDTPMLNSAELGRMVAMIKQARNRDMPVAIVVQSETLRHVLHVVKMELYSSICVSHGEARLLLNAKLAGLERTSEQVTGLLIGNEKSQTPLIGAAANELMALHLPGTEEFMREILDPLKAYEDWLWRRRSDSEGRFILWHGDESGWDDSVRHYPVPARPFDVQVHCLQLRDWLLRAAVKYTPQDAKYIRSIRERRDLTRETLATYYCAEDKWNYDLAGDGSSGSDEYRRRICASGMFDLVLPERRPTEHVVSALEHERIFACEQPVPSLAQCDEAYRPHGWGWNGPVWLQLNYFTISGLLNQGQYAPAFALWDKTKALLIREGLPCSYELYDPHSGTGLGCPDYSWQAMINHLIIRWFAGVHDLLLIPHLPPDMQRLRISNLPTRITAVSYRRKGNQLKVDVQFRGRPQRFGLAPGSLGNIVSMQSGLPEDIVSWSNGRWLFKLAGEHDSLSIRLELKEQPDA